MARLTAQTETKQHRFKLFLAVRLVEVHLHPELEAFLLAVAAAAAATVGFEDLFHAGVANVETVAARFDLELGKKSLSLCVIRDR